MMNKKGQEMMIVMFILAVMGLAILLFVFYQVNWSGEINRNVCKASVATRGLAGVGPDAGVNYAPLRCQTAKICITGKLFGRGDCDEFKNEDSVVNMRVSNDDSQKTLDEIQRIYALETLSCWNMMGQGQISLFHQTAAQDFGFGEIYPSCVICSRIAVDESSLDKVRFKDMDLFNYMATHLIQDQERTYLEIISDTQKGVGLNVQELSEVNFDLKIEGDDKNVYGVGEIQANVDDFGDLEVEEVPEETAIMFMQITSPKYGEVFRNQLLVAAGVGTGTASFVPGGKAVIGSVVKAVGAGKSAVVAAAAIAMVAGYDVYAVSKNRAITATYCGDVEAGDNVYGGCSAVRTVNYDVNDILSYCGVIESID